MPTFSPIDPLLAKTNQSEVAASATKRELANILSSYVGWFDPFCELIQNSLDAIDLRAKEAEGYSAKLSVVINIHDNYIIVTDNGIGLDEASFSQFLAPSISFKTQKSRGHKGVGATFLAYGFNEIQIATKTPNFSVVGKMEGCRKWLSEENPASNPKLIEDTRGPLDSNFKGMDRGVSIYIKFDKTTRPNDLKWIKTCTAESWLRILKIKTGLGAFYEDVNLDVNIVVFDAANNRTEAKSKGTAYLWPHTLVGKALRYTEIIEKEDSLFKKSGPDFSMPSKFKNLDAFYDKWNSARIQSELNELSDESKEILARHAPDLYFCYMSTAKAWDKINEALGVRANYNLMYGGIQLAANNMPQGERILIPLKRYTGRQYQVHILIHFSNYTPDMGRKGFHKEVVEFSEEVSKQMVDGPLQRAKKYLRPITGSAVDIAITTQIDQWKREMETHELSHPIRLQNRNFFLPVNELLISSEPTREQDVIALFNQLIAGGVVRGIKIMSTNERLTYDGLFRSVVDKAHHIYHAETNPLGIAESRTTEFKELPFVSSSQILEYKFNLDGLMEEIDSEDKAANAIDLVVVWDVGEKYKEKYKITSLLLDSSDRPYHGVTHLMTNLSTNQVEMKLIVLKDMLNLLKDSANEIRRQETLYGEN